MTFWAPGLRGGRNKGEVNLSLGRVTRGPGDVHCGSNMPWAVVSANFASTEYVLGDQQEAQEALLRSRCCEPPAFTPEMMMPCPSMCGALQREGSLMHAARRMPSMLAKRRPTVVAPEYIMPQITWLNAARSAAGLKLLETNTLKLVELGKPMKVELRHAVEPLSPLCGAVLEPSLPSSGPSASSSHLPLSTDASSFLVEKSALASPYTLCESSLAALVHRLELFLQEASRAETKAKELTVDSDSDVIAHTSANIGRDTSLDVRSDTVCRSIANISVVRACLDTATADDADLVFLAPVDRPEIVNEQCVMSGQVVRMYHGTSNTAAKQIQAHGFDRSNSGRFGEGLYLTHLVEHAQCYGAAVLAVDVDVGRVLNIINSKLTEEEYGALYVGLHDWDANWRSEGYDSVYWKGLQEEMSDDSGIYGDELCVYDLRRVAVVGVAFGGDDLAPTPATIKDASHSPVPHASGVEAHPSATHRRSDEAMRLRQREKALLGESRGRFLSVVCLFAIGAALWRCRPRHW